MSGATEAPATSDDTKRDDMETDLEVSVLAFRVDTLMVGNVAWPVTTGTHWPNIWIASVDESMLRGSDTERTQ